MSANKLEEIIRIHKDIFKTPNIYQGSEDGWVEIFSENFRKNTQDQELILFYFYEGKYYYPIWAEFRLINNNVLFLIKEFQVNSFALLRRILVSSLEKEERYVSEIRALVFHTLNLPPHSIPLNEFEIHAEERIDVFEKK